MDANGLLVAFGVALIAAGLLYRTPFPVQPMKAIGAAAVSRPRSRRVWVRRLSSARR
jgi:hypothetical protein